VLDGARRQGAGAGHVISLQHRHLAAALDHSGTGRAVAVTVAGQQQHGSVLEPEVPLIWPTRLGEILGLRVAGGGPVPFPPSSVGPPQPDLFQLGALPWLEVAEERLASDPPQPDLFQLGALPAIAFLLIELLQQGAGPFGQLWP